MSWKTILIAVFIAAGIQGCSIGAATRVLFMGMPDRVVPEKRSITLTIHGGAKLNAKFEGDVARPLRLCVYIHKIEDWTPPLDLSAPCVEQDSKLTKALKMTLLADRVAYVTESVAYQDAHWITVTGDFADQGEKGKGILKIKSPAEVDSCHWLNIDRNQIHEVKKNSAGNQPTCK
jgi:predicted component of type VI protein secretion system